jgi:hypothetical protein
MPMPIVFDKKRAEEIMDCITHGKPIAPDGKAGWNLYDMLAVAGACYFGVLSRGPQRIPGTEIDLSKVPEEYREAHEDTFVTEIHDAIEWYGNATMLVTDGKYDEGFDRIHKALVRRNGDEKLLIPIEGFRTRRGE